MCTCVCVMCHGSLKKMWDAVVEMELQVIVSHPRFGEQNFVSLKELQVFLTSEPSLQVQFMSILQFQMRRN